MLYIAKDEDKFPKAGELATEIMDVADNARAEGVTLARRIRRLRRTAGYSQPEDETPGDALIYFSKEMLMVAFRLLSCAHHCAGRATSFSNEFVAEIGGIRDQLGSFILTQEKMSGRDINADPPIAMPWEAYKPRVNRDA
jgi:hypothetical protein